MAGSEKKRRGRPPGKKNTPKPPPTPPGGHQPGPNGEPPAAAPTLIKKYSNRRLYDTRRSKYITLDDLVEILAKGEDIQVLDENTGEDVTKRVLAQLVLHEEEDKHLNLLPLAFLKKLLQYRDDSVREYFQRYMMTSLDAYMGAQKAMEQRMGSFAGGAFDPSRMPNMFPWFNPGQFPGGFPGMPGFPPTPGYPPQQGSTPPPANPSQPPPPQTQSTPPSQRGPQAYPDSSAPSRGAGPAGDQEEEVQEDLAELRRRLAMLEQRYGKK